MAKGSKSRSSSKTLKSLKSLKNSVSSLNSKVTNTINPVQTNPIEEYQRNSAMTGSFIIVAILYIVNFMINLYALLWINKLEEISCKCSENWKRDFIKYFLYTYFIILIIQIIMYIATGHGLDDSNSSIVVMFVVIYNLFAIVAMFVAIFYIDQLKSEQCTCSEDVRREVFYYYNFIRLALFGLVLLMMLMTMLFVGNILSKLSVK